ncbi:MAG: tetratricopeptide repeat protein [Planctomycetes bacterium]|nr:tetratricopeptide repeat protein [Planctomycetota bacterium]
MTTATPGQPPPAIATSTRAAPAAAPPRRRNYPRWRAVSLSLVYVVFALHILHWKLTGKTLAPLELNEVMYTLELGIVTAGFLFMCLLVVAAGLFGRFFCSWACHIIVLQDFCAWLLRRLGLRARPLRSRVLLWVPPLTAAYMFLWPQIVRAWRDKAFPTFHVATDRDGWASFVTDNFWRNLPGPGVIAITFLVCGFLIVYLLGTRSFCRYVCPYGAIFGLADRVAPGRIRLTGTCQKCGTCTANCTSGIRVHEEIARHGKVVSAACLKDLDCVSVCPHGALSYGFARSALVQAASDDDRAAPASDFTAWEEVFLGGVFVAVLLSFRGLYGQVPFLLSLALGVVIGYLLVLGLRLVARPTVQTVGLLRLKEQGRLTVAGGAFAVLALFLAAFVAHSGFVRYHEYSGTLAAVGLNEDSDPAQSAADAGRVHAHLTVCDRWGLLANPRTHRGLIKSSMLLRRYDEVRQRAADYLMRFDDDPRVRLDLAYAFAATGRLAEAEREYRQVIAPGGGVPAPAASVGAAHQGLAAMLAGVGDYPAAEQELRRAVAADPAAARAHRELGGVLVELGRLEEAVESLQEALRLSPRLRLAHYNLGTVLGRLGRFPQAVEMYERALVLAPDDADLHNNLGYALIRTGRLDEAQQRFERAVAIDPDHADAHFNLGGLLARRNQPERAEQHLLAAARLSPQYARLLSQPQ